METPSIVHSHGNRLFGRQWRWGGRLSHDRHGPLYGVPRLDLLQLYFLTGVLATYANLIQINLLVLVLLIAVTFVFRRPRVPLLSPLLCLYGLVTALSLFNHYRLYDQVGGIPEAARTMPVAFLAMLACRACTVPGLFERAATMNMLPLVFMIPVGGHYEWGRYHSAFVSEIIHGEAMVIGFAVGLCAMWERRFRWPLMAALFASGSYIFLAASRSMFVFFMLAVLSLVFARRKRSVWQIAMIVAIGAVIVFLALPTMTARQRGRFGQDFSWQKHFSDVGSGQASDPSSVTRMSFIAVTFRAIQSDWLGFGSANFPYVLATYGHGFLRRASHPHSGLADALITGGYPGLCLYALILVYMLWIGRRDPVMRICSIWLVLAVFVATTLPDRILWPLLAIAERELEISRSQQTLDLLGVLEEEPAFGATAGILANQ